MWLLTGLAVGIVGLLAVAYYGRSKAAAESEKWMKEDCE